MSEQRAAPPSRVPPEEKGSRATSTSARRWILGSLVALLIVVPGFLVFITVWFANPATESVSTVGPADAVVLFAGSPDRLRTAIQLMKTGAAPDLVIPNGMEVAPSLCNGAPPFHVYCPETEGVNTEGEARAIGHLATEKGWSRLTAVTSIYHVRRATSLLAQCFDGEIVAVASDDDTAREDWARRLPHEWAGFIAGVILHPGC